MAQDHLEKCRLANLGMPCLLVSVVVYAVGIFPAMSNRNAVNGLHLARYIPTLWLDIYPQSHRSTETLRPAGPTDLTGSATQGFFAIATFM